MTHTKAKRSCIGFGPYEGICPNPIDPKRNPYWCPRCDALRIEHLDRRFREIEQAFGGKRQEARP